jgi:hypothetical protein
VPAVDLLGHRFRIEQAKRVNDLFPQAALIICI